MALLGQIQSVSELQLAFLHLPPVQVVPFEQSEGCEQVSLQLITGVGVGVIVGVAVGVEVGLAVGLVVGVAVGVGVLSLQTQSVSVSQLGFRQILLMHSRVPAHWLSFPVVQAKLQATGGAVGEAVGVGVLIVKTTSSQAITSAWQE